MFLDVYKSELVIELIRPDARFLGLAIRVYIDSVFCQSRSIHYLNATQLIA
jgi:hypothetical protein